MPLKDFVMTGRGVTIICRPGVTKKCRGGSLPLPDYKHSYLIEWKFTEGKSRPIVLNKFGGLRGIERLRRYASVLAEMRGNGFPFAFSEEGGIGLQDFSTDHFYQLSADDLAREEDDAHEDRGYPGRGL